ncbi:MULTISPECIES: hypothetical protein [unclassified Streptomyces]|uniref:hypothetical protein n=1 Tax=unclassified Streptomyces TaxID=2593676 RepID=UPI0006AF0328|nr:MULTISPECIES: hypothetical protein [unclassified Streptomyces]KOX26590.1 hypothetical protein ADL06_15380 [Streptomyces sp. NRRL F-6491]KOX50008.1 hypothetical protein ADL08_07405 [Streptomyces sp. NRRL F-6492]
MTGQLAFVESPVQLLNVLEWAHTRSTGPSSATGTAPTADAPGTGTAPGTGAPAPVTASGTAPAPAPDAAPAASPLTVVVLSPTDPMSRGQLRRMAQLARDEGLTVHWQEARGGRGALVRTLRRLAGPLRSAERVIIGDPFSRYVQLLLTLFGPRHLTVVDDGTATMEFAAQLGRGERLVRWHRKGSLGPRELVLAPVTTLARRRLAPARGRTVEVFTSLPVQAPAGVEVTENTYAWTRSRFGPPLLTGGADLVGTSLVETGVVDAGHYTRVVGELARTHGATRYFAHRRESAEKLHRIAVETGLQVVRPDLPLELVARRGPVGRTIVSFPSTVVHTLPLALAGTGVKVAVCEVAPEWLRATASPRAQGFLSGVTGTAAHEVDRLTARRTPSVDRLGFG